MLKMPVKINTMLVSNLKNRAFRGVAGDIKEGFTSDIVVSSLVSKTYIENVNREIAKMCRKNCSIVLILLATIIIWFTLN